MVPPSSTFIFVSSSSSCHPHFLISSSRYSYSSPFPPLLQRMAIALAPGRWSLYVNKFKNRQPALDPTRLHLQFLEQDEAVLSCSAQSSGCLLLTSKGRLYLSSSESGSELAFHPFDFLPSSPSQVVQARFIWDRDRFLIALLHLDGSLFLTKRHRNDPFARSSPAYPPQLLARGVRVLGPLLSNSVNAVRLVVVQRFSTVAAIDSSPDGGITNRPLPSPPLLHNQKVIFSFPGDSHATTFAIGGTI